MMRPEDEPRLDRGTNTVDKDNEVNERCIRSQNPLQTLQKSMQNHLRRYQIPGHTDFQDPPDPSREPYQEKERKFWRGTPRRARKRTPKSAENDEKIRSRFRLVFHTIFGSLSNLILLPTCFPKIGIKQSRVTYNETICIGVFLVRTCMQKKQTCL